MAKRLVYPTIWTPMHRMVRPDGSIQGGSQPTITIVNTVNGSDVLEWKKKIDLRRNAASNYSRREVLRAQQLSVLSQLKDYRGWFNTTWTGIPGYTVVHALPSDAVLKDQALTRAKRKLRSLDEQFKSFVPIAEVKETRKLVRQVADSTTGVLKALLDIKKGRYVHKSKAAADAWLTWSFGVAPTIGDLNSLVNTIGDYLTRNDFSATIRGTASKRFNFEVPYSRIGLSDGSNFIPVYSGVASLKYQYTAGVRFPIKSSNDYGVEDKFGLNFGEMVPAAWELTPFSWIGDYFSTMGAFLEDAFETPSGYTYYCTLATTYFYDYAVKVTAFTQPGGWDQRARLLQDGKFRGYYYLREVIGDLPHVALRLKTMDEVGRNSMNRLLNLSSLLVKDKRNLFFR